MKQKILILLILCLLLAPANLSFAHEGHNEAFSGGETTATASKAIQVDPEGQQAIGIQFQTVASGSLNHILQATGQVQPSESQAFDINAPAGGMVRQVYVKQGDYVRAGQTVATLYSPQIAETLSNLLQEKARIQAEIATISTQAQRDISVKSKEVELTRINYQREQTLLSEGITARKDYIEAKNAYETAQVELSALKRQSAQKITLLNRQLALTISAVKSQLRALGLASGTVERSLSNWQITSTLPIVSPVSGVVTFRDVTLGETVETTKRLLSIVNLSPIWVVVNVFQEQLSQIRVGQSVRITTASNQTVHGEISNIGTVVDPAQRTLPVRIVSSNPGELLKPGMFVRAEIVTGQSGANRMVVPAAALVEDNGRTLVYVKQGNRFLPTPVQVGQRTSEQMEILDGLYAGDQVVIRGAKQLHAQALLAARSGGTAETKAQTTTTTEIENSWLPVLFGILIGLALAGLGAMSWFWSQRQSQLKRR